MGLVDELAKLEELRRSGSLSDAEFAKAKATLLGQAPAGPAPDLINHVANQVAVLKYKHELDRIDREWEIERLQYGIPFGRSVGTFEPTRLMGIVLAILGGGFGVGMMIVSASTSDAFFTLVGLACGILGIGYGVNMYSKAEKYQAARAAYYDRRARVMTEQSATDDRPREHGTSSQHIKPS